jgi:exopolysaccharide biosynthesis WecB/TagA/CpsF family protein
LLFAVFVLSLRLSEFLNYTLINGVKPNILFVGVGAPKQEKWMYHNIDQLQINVALGIGASFDFIAGTIKRAPKTFRNAGMDGSGILPTNPSGCSGGILLTAPSSSYSFTSS